MPLKVNEPVPTLTMLLDLPMGPENAVLRFFAPIMNVADTPGLAKLGLPSEPLPVKAPRRAILVSRLNKLPSTINTVLSPPLSRAAPPVLNRTEAPLETTTVPGNDAQDTVPPMDIGPE